MPGRRKAAAKQRDRFTRLKRAGSCGGARSFRGLARFITGETGALQKGYSAMPLSIYFENGRIPSDWDRNGNAISFLCLFVVLWSKSGKGRQYVN